MTTHPKTESLKIMLQEWQRVQTFQSSDIDEVRQIVDMSLRSAILIDNAAAIPFALKENLTSKTGLFRKYYLDWDRGMDRQTMKFLSSNVVTTLKPHDIPQVMEKTELYLFGKVNIFNSKEGGEEKDQEQLGKAFFTHLEAVPSGWKTLISTHEAEANVSSIIGLDWEEFLEETLSMVDKLASVKEEKLMHKQYYQVIYPHKYNGVLRKLSIVHLAYDQRIQDNLNRLMAFLQSI
jgi:hypothetical protein